MKTNPTHWTAVINLTDKGNEIIEIKIRNYGFSLSDVANKVQALLSLEDWENEILGTCELVEIYPTY